MKILIGGVPYGRDNVGDEAIVATVIQSVRKAFPDAKITVSTDEQEHLAKKMNVRTVPLFGFEEPPYDIKQLDEEMKRADAYIWGGATGLSDYPEFALSIADSALKNNTKLVLYSVGMNAVLNPSLYKLSDSGKKKALELFGKCCLNIIDPVKIIEDSKVKSTKQHIKDTLNQASLIIVRDQPSKEQLEECGVTKEIHSTTDPAILLEPCSNERLDEIWKQNNVWDDDIPIVGVCISAQRQVKQIDDIASVLDYLIKTKKVHILFIPMNDKTDYVLMKDMTGKMKFAGQTRILKGRYEPEEIAAAASRMSLIISSRLHLIILAAIFTIPVTGLSRGSKIDKYLKLFNEKTPGSVENFDVAGLKKTAIRLLDSKEEFQKKYSAVIKELKEKAMENIKLLTTIIK